VGFLSLLFFWRGCGVFSGKMRETGRSYSAILNCSFERSFEVAVFQCLYGCDSGQGPSLAFMCCEW
jgi:hypothetical protein